MKKAMLLILMLLLACSTVGCKSNDANTPENTTNATSVPSKETDAGDDFSGIPLTTKQSGSDSELNTLVPQYTNEPEVTENTVDAED